MNDFLYWIINDYKSNKFRFILEVTAWILSIGCSITMAITVPNPPFLILYPIFITQCIMYGFAAFSRRSFGMLANYCLLVTIDIIGYFRMVL